MKKKLKVLVLVLAFAFAAMGGAYAMWFDTLTVAETASTGSLDLNWEGIHVVDPAPNYAGFIPPNVYGTYNRDGLDTMDVGNPNDNKNIGYLDGRIDAVASTQGGDQDKASANDQLTVTLTNGYPGYQEYIDVRIKNSGTVPAKFEVSGLDTVPAWLLVEIQKDGQAFNWEGFQIEPGQSVPVRIVNRVIENIGDGEIAPQNATATFTLSLKGIQWNEYNYTLHDQIQFPRDDNYPYPAN